MEGKQCSNVPCKQKCLHLQLCLSFILEESASEEILLQAENQSKSRFIYPSLLRFLLSVVCGIYDGKIETDAETYQGFVGN
jgi:hypothetical protein